MEVNDVKGDLNDISAGKKKLIIHVIGVHCKHLLGAMSWIKKELKKYKSKYALVSKAKVHVHQRFCSQRNIG